MKKIVKHITKIRTIDVFVYIMESYVNINASSITFNIQDEQYAKRVHRYYIKDGHQLVHQSFLYENVYLMRLFNKHGPVIGNCFTNKSFRGKSIYPKVINYIAKKYLELHGNPVYVIVDKDNAASIRGIEKGGFTLFASVKARRWLWFYLSKRIDRNL